LSLPHWIKWNKDKGMYKISNGMECFEQSKMDCLFRQEFDYNKMINEIYPLSKTQVDFHHNMIGYKKGVIMGSWHKLMQTNGDLWVLRKYGYSENEIWNKMKPEIIEKIHENFDNLITWTDYVGNEMGLGKYILSKEKINETKKLQIVVKLRNFDIIKKIDI
jgi:hypothetical protein